jgi:hypothetical protein
MSWLLHIHGLSLQYFQARRMLMITAHCATRVIEPLGYTVCLLRPRGILVYTLVFPRT